MYSSGHCVRRGYVYNVIMILHDDYMSIMFNIVYIADHGSITLESSCRHMAGHVAGSPLPWDFATLCFRGAVKHQVEQVNHNNL